MNGVEKAVSDLVDIEWVAPPPSASMRAVCDSSGRRAKPGVILGWTGGPGLPRGGGVFQWG